MKAIVTKETEDGFYALYRSYYDGKIGLSVDEYMVTKHIGGEFFVFLVSKNDQDASPEYWVVQGAKDEAHAIKKVKKYGHRNKHT